VSFKPVNRHLLLKDVVLPQEKEKSTILVPDDYNVKVSPYGVYEVVSAADDCTKIGTLTNKAKVLVNNSMVEEINIDEDNLLLILENHVYGVFNN
jgi:hypothetical protein